MMDYDPRDIEPTEARRCECGKMIIQIGDIPEEADEDGDGTGVEHECEYSEDIIGSGEDIDWDKIDGPAPDDEVHDLAAEADRAEYRRLTKIAEGASPSKRFDHSACSHDKTKAARAKCRRSRQA